MNFDYLLPVNFNYQLPVNFDYLIPVNFDYLLPVIFDYFVILGNHLFSITLNAMGGDFAFDLHLSDEMLVIPKFYSGEVLFYHIPKKS